MRRTLLLTAAGSACLTMLAIWGMAQTKLLTFMKLENSRVRVTEVIYPPGTPRERQSRPSDQLIVFLDDCEYQRIDSATKEKTVQRRKAGEVIFHAKAEDAPVLINLGQKPYRTLVIELK